MELHTKSPQDSPRGEAKELPPSSPTTGRVEAQEMACGKRADYPDRMGGSIGS